MSCGCENKSAGAGAQLVAQVRRAEREEPAGGLLVFDVRVKTGSIASRVVPSGGWPAGVRRVRLLPLTYSGGDTPQVGGSSDSAGAGFDLEVVTAAGMAERVAAQWGAWFRPGSEPWVWRVAAAGGALESIRIQAFIE